MASAHANLVKGINNRKQTSYRGKPLFICQTNPTARPSMASGNLGLELTGSLLLIVDRLLWNGPNSWHFIFAHRSELWITEVRLEWLVSELLIKRVERQKRLYSFSEMAPRKEVMGGVIKSRKVQPRPMEPWWIFIVRMLLTHFTWTNSSISSSSLFTTQPMSPFLKLA